MGVALYDFNLDEGSVDNTGNSPTENLDEERWSPLGDLLLLTLFTVSYAIATTVAPSLFYTSALFFPILFVYSLPVAYVLERGYKRTTGNSPDTVFGYKGQVGTLAVSMVLVGVVVHTEPLLILSPASVLGVDIGQLPFTTQSANGILVSVWSASWYAFLVPALGILDIGWVRCLEDWKENIAAKIAWNGIVSSCVGVLLWTALPFTTSPLQPHVGFKHLLIASIVFIYAYGITTD
ncbi:hypothetical protein [Haloarcula brevis]|uniref:hypothetical protein n=1 Tax=Haloarcula brevis TaxID=3111453 RepID=UPI00300E7398